MQLIDFVIVVLQYQVSIEILLFFIQLFESLGPLGFLLGAKPVFITFFPDYLLLVRGHLVLKIVYNCAEVKEIIHGHWVAPKPWIKYLSA